MSIAEHPTQQDAPDEIRNEVILASAGTGKTQSLSARYLKLIDLGHDPGRILATTFTRKAAGEIFERVLKRLADSTHDEKSREQLSEQTGIAFTTERCQSLLLNLTKNMHRVRIGTLDSFFHQIALSLGPELGLPPVWTIADEIDDARIRSESLAEMLDDHPVEEVTRLVHMLAKGDSERKTHKFLLDIINSLYIIHRDSSGNSAVWDSKLPAPLDKKTLAQALQTFEAAGAELTGIALPKAHGSSTDAIRFENWQEFLVKGIGKSVSEGNPKYGSSKIPESVIAAYQPMVKHAIASLLAFESQKVSGARDLIDKFAASYEQKKIDREMIQFDDIPTRMSRLIDQNRDRLAYRMDAQLDHLLLDEFQDTSGAQWRAIEPFAKRIAQAGELSGGSADPNDEPTDESTGEATDEPKDAGSVFAVGDIKQAIYGWRGGQAEILESLPSQLGKVESLQLVKTWRCSQPVVDTVNRVFNGIKNHANLGVHESGIDAWCSQFTNHETARNHPGYATLQTTSVKGDARQRLKDVTAFINGLRDAIGHDKTIGVLVKTNKTVSELVGLLREAGVPASQEGRSPLTDSAAIQQILSACKLADSPGDDVARFHVQQGLYRELGEALDREHAIELADDIRRRLMEVGYGPVVKEWADRLRPLCSKRELQRLQQIVELAYAYQSRLSDARPGLRPTEFVDFVERRPISNSTEATVRVMVVHQAKGLEFDAVVVTETESKLHRQRSFVVRRSKNTFRPEHVFTYSSKSILPLLTESIRQTQDADTDTNTRETLCGLYVALTRAKHAMHIFVDPDAPDKDLKQLPSTMGGWLRAALVGVKRADPDSILFETGDARWYEAKAEPADDSQDSEDENSEGTQEVRYQIAKPIRLKKQSGSGRAQEILSPSQRSAGAKIKGNQWYSKDRESAFEYGTLIHNFFEQIVWLERDLFDSGPPEESLLRAIAIRNQIRWINVDDAIGDFYSMLEHDSISRLLHESTYAPELAAWWKKQTGRELSGLLRLEVFNEQPVLFNENGNVGTGTIDRLVLAKAGNRIAAAEVIDFKTDAARNENDCRKLATKYKDQLHKYRDAVSEMFDVPKKRIRTRLALVNGGFVVDA